MGSNSVNGISAVDKIASHPPSSINRQKSSPIVRAALCHVSPFILDAEKTTQKCITLIHEAADNGAHIVVFPETFLPAFPYWSPLLAPSEGHEFFIAMAKSSVYSDGREVDAIRAAAKERKIMVSLGISEKARYSAATLFNANLIIDISGDVVVHHRKLVPTFYEKLTWTPGDGHGLKTVEVTAQSADGVTGTVKFSTLICGENTNSLARYAMIAQGTRFHITCWPAKSIMGAASAGSADDLDVKKAKHGVFDNIHLNRIRCGSACVEGKAYGAICSALMFPDMVETIVSMSPSHAKEKVRLALEGSSQAESVFLDPSGTVIPGFTIDSTTGLKSHVESLRYDEGILYADMDMEATVEGKQYHDIVGMYQRLDVFDLKVITARRLPATFSAI
jgi:nitrilase